MKYDLTEYYEGGGEEDFAEITAMNKKISLFSDFLIKSHIDFSINNFKGTEIGKCIKINDSKIEVDFHKSGLVIFRTSEVSQDE